MIYAKLIWLNHDSDQPRDWFYEVTEDRETVTRMVEVYGDGSIISDSLEFYEKGKAPFVDSLVGERFDDLPSDGEVSYEIIDRMEFEKIWNQGIRKAEEADWR